MATGHVPTPSGMMGLVVIDRAGPPTALLVSQASAQTPVSIGELDPRHVAESTAALDKPRCLIYSI